MIILSIIVVINTLCIIYLIISKHSKLYFQFRKETSFIENTLLGYSLILWKKLSEHSAESKFSFYLKIRDKNKVETREEVCRMIAKYSPQQKRQVLSAKFSWLKTINEVKQFEKDYSVVDSKLVSELVSGFKYR